MTRHTHNIVDTHTLPTGYLFTGNYSKGPLETLTIGDYGKRHNVKADFLGYTREIAGVPNTHCMPLSEKWVITLSTQYGCKMGCTFCDVPKVAWRGNVPEADLVAQFQNALGLFPNVSYTERLNIHFARMGDPIFNDAVFSFAEWLADCKPELQANMGLRAEVIHPVLTTSCPKNYAKLGERIARWCAIKNHSFRGQAGLQLSINSTNDAQRHAMFGGTSASLAEIAAIARTLPDPIGRKYCLNFAYASGYEVDGRKLAALFDPRIFMAKITPIHNNNACSANGIETVGGYDSFRPYAEPEASLKNAGFDVLVFVPSLDEEHGLVTCGNAILGGSALKVQGARLNIVGQPGAAA